MAVSALIALDLSKKRVKDYKFSWERALASSSKLQYSHARLFSLIDACSPLLTSLDEGNIATETLTEPEALELAFQIGRWEEVLSEAATTLEPQHIVTYLFTLASTSSKAIGALQVKYMSVTSIIGSVSAFRNANFTYIYIYAICKNMDLPPGENEHRNCTGTFSCSDSAFYLCQKSFGRGDESSWHNTLRSSVILNQNTFNKLIVRVT